ncbi:MAG: hypothetical protein QM762_12695 [Chryseolinea sp.]
MGAFNDFITAAKGLMNGIVPFGGTMAPTNEGFPIAFAQNIRGGFYALESVDQLVDIPYDNLQLNMEVVVGSPSRKKYYLKQLPPTDTRVSEIPGYTLSDYWEEVVVTGGEGDPGPQGWAPVILPEDDGPQRVVLRLTDWIGGGGTKPPVPDANNSYLGPNGYVAKSNATSLKGPKGDNGETVVNNFRPEYYVNSGSRSNTAPSTIFDRPAGQFYRPDPTLTVVNSHTAARKFHIVAEMPVSNDSGSDSWAVRLLKQTPSGDELLDENYSRQDYVNAAPYQSVHKVMLFATITLAAAESCLIKVSLAQTNGVASKYSPPFIEAFGL